MWINANCIENKFVSWRVLSSRTNFHQNANKIYNRHYLSSKSEGLPLALLEYGMSGLPVVVTDVGDCSLLVNDKSFGQLVDKNDYKQFAESIKQLILDKDYRLFCADNLNQKVTREYSEKHVLSDIISIYKSII